MIVFLSGTLYLSSCQKEANVDVVSAAHENTLISVEDRGPCSTSCTGTIQMEANTNLGEIYPLEVIVESRLCSNQNWTLVKKWIINNFLDFLEPFPIKQDHFYRITVINKGTYTLSNFTSVIKNPYPVNGGDKNKMIARVGNIQPYATKVEVYRQNLPIPNPPLGRGNCGCPLDISCP